tara:strand:+ start:168 stop:908 length:741 start_codon:yes stop_codon:yes gene_type:complete
MARAGYDILWKSWARLREKDQGIYPVVHQGIQRSGTNFLSAVLSKADYRIINRIDPARDAPRHKHFRWQDDKSSIVMDSRYGNDRHVGSVAEINRICGYPEDQKHIVLFREPRDWLDGIFRWGLANGWFPSQEAFFEGDLHRAYLREWDAYYAKWADLAARDPAGVLLVSYGDLRRDARAGVLAIDRFMGVERATPLGTDFTIDKVRHSKPMTEKRKGLEHPGIDAALNAPFAFDWQAHVLSGVPA